MALRRSASRSFLMSTSLMRIWPSVGSYNLAMSLRMVLLPEPLLPTMTCEMLADENLKGETHAKLPSFDFEAGISQCIHITTGIPKGDALEFNADPELQALIVFGKGHTQFRVILIGDFGVGVYFDAIRYFSDLVELPDSRQLVGDGPCLIYEREGGIGEGLGGLSDEVERSEGEGDGRRLLDCPKSEYDLWGVRG